jgi:hypothetical protein
MLSSSLFDLNGIVNQIKRALFVPSPVPNSSKSKYLSLVHKDKKQEQGTGRACTVPSVQIVTWNCVDLEPLLFRSAAQI